MPLPALRDTKYQSKRNKCSPEILVSRWGRCSSPGARKTQVDIRKLEDAPCLALDLALSPRLCGNLLNTELLRDLDTWPWNSGFIKTILTHIMTNSSCHMRQWYQVQTDIIFKEITLRPQGTFPGPHDHRQMLDADVMQG